MPKAPKKVTKMPDVSGALRSARERLAETQEQFAARFGVDQATISRWEDGSAPKRGPTFMWLTRVLDDIARVHPT